MDLSFDAKVISAEAVLATSYWCADRIVADITQDGEVVKVSLSGRSGTEVTSRDAEDFKVMAVHNQIRKQLANQFAAMETAIVQKAFAPVSSRG